MMASLLIFIVLAVLYGLVFGWSHVPLLIGVAVATAIVTFVFERIRNKRH